jgi:hypothetical protein
MTPTPTPSSQDAFVERIVQEVIRRLLAMQLRGSQLAQTSPAETAMFVSQVQPATSHTPPAPFSIGDKLITTKTLEQLPPGSFEVLIAPRAIVTPLAKDEARERGIRLIRNTVPVVSAKRTAR